MVGNDFSEIERICPGYTLEPIETLRGYQRCVDLQLRVWNYADSADVVPMAFLAITNHNGGILLGAYDARHSMVGFVYSILGFHHRRLVQHSHMLGVLDKHRNRNLGLALKLAQRQCALEQGVKRIVWTYDPLQSLNAHFNFCNLGIWVNTYEVNIYGRSSSVLHRGLDTDRFFACWELNSHRVRRKVQQALRGVKEREDRPNLPVINSLRSIGERLPEPAGGLKDLREGRFLFELPADINRLKSERLQAARAFQRQLRSVCLTYFARGYRVTNFYTNTASGYRRYFYLFQNLRRGHRRDI